MSDMEILSELILESALIPHENEYGKPVIKLQEAGAKGSVSFIRKIPLDAIVIKADEFPAPKKFFKGDKGECKRADFIIISEEKKVILYVELKAGASEFQPYSKTAKRGFLFNLLLQRNRKTVLERKYISRWLCASVCWHGEFECQ